MAGQVRVGERVVDKAGTLIPEDAPLTVATPPRYVSRGGTKLEAALERFALDVDGCVAVDVGASTGGFTDCLLQHGVVRVYSVDVGYGQLAWSLRQNPRVVVMERTNIRYVDTLAERCDLATVDVSFISLRLVLPVVRRLLKPEGFIIALIKPQFEAGRGQVGKGGVVREPAQHRQILEDVLGWAQADGFAVCGLIASPMRGPAGNVEFLVWLGQDCSGVHSPLDSLIDRVLEEVPLLSSRHE